MRSHRNSRHKPHQAGFGTFFDKKRAFIEPFRAQVSSLLGRGFSAANLPEGSLSRSKSVLISSSIFTGMFLW